ncbi:class I SAM-dependent methyltransferase [Mycobacterium asiaticum]|uniref:SAM-dependent methyltransferase n=1 Tax=Mycobacterium asiaticum TaxID=1790 RepID=A0A1A3NQG9_MYCAS|nr:methyltransferase domain-containing protein [Mycobacterium asiaticum]OBK23615.1 SAM-dependent methyltransferase [Mycobacterium asiaticum]
MSVLYGSQMGVRDAVMAGIAKQLGHPSGLRGRLVGAALNRGNRRLVSAAARALQPDAAAALADVGFGGGVGLKFLLDSVGPAGSVHGVEVSETMLSQAAARYRREIATGRLSLHSGSMTQLPLDDGALDGVITVNTIYFVAELDAAFRELARVLNSRGRLVIGLADPDVMAKLPFTGHGFQLRPVTDVIDTLRSTGLAVEHRQISDDVNAPHLLIAQAVA